MLSSSNWYIQSYSSWAGIQTKIENWKKNGIKKRNIIPFHPIYIIDIYNIYNISLSIYKMKKRKKSHALFTNMAMKMENDTYFQIHDFGPNSFQENFICGFNHTKNTIFFIAFRNDFGKNWWIWKMFGLQFWIWSHTSFNESLSSGTLFNNNALKSTNIGFLENMMNVTAVKGISLKLVSTAFFFQKPTSFCVVRQPKKKNRFASEGQVRFF